MLRPIKTDELDPQTVDFNLESLKTWDLCYKAYPTQENSFGLISKLIK